jgi:N-formylglutamate deformylase
MTQALRELTMGDGPVVATAIHNGHAVREEVADLLALSPMDRLREEDPFTGLWTAIGGTQIVVQRSRFEVDLNRPRETAVYLEPEDAWGLQVWKKRPPAEIIAGSLAEYDAFYAEVQRVFAGLAGRSGRFVVFDLHTYNHRRQGPSGPPANPELNPEVNVGTGSMDRRRWGPVVDRFIADLRAFDFLDRRLDVRENVKFKGGNLSRWIHETFPDSGCALAIEFKKFFMDEWTGKADQDQLEAVRRALEFARQGVLDVLGEL